MSTLNTRPCRYCGRKIVMLQNTETGRDIHLDATTTKKCYSVNGNGTCSPCGEEVLVSHFATCPHIINGSGKKGRKANESQRGAEA